MGKGIKYLIVAIAVILSVIAVGYPLISIVLLLDLILFVLLKRNEEKNMKRNIGKYALWVTLFLIAVVVFCLSLILLSLACM